MRFSAKSIGYSIASKWLFNRAIGYATPYLVDDGPNAAGLETKVFFIQGICYLRCFCLDRGAKVICG